MNRSDAATQVLVDRGAELATQLDEAQRKIAAVLGLLDCGQGVTPGCCAACNGTGWSGEQATNGMCSDCYATGHAHGPVDADDLGDFLAAVRRAALGEQS